jgi:hypothetical protein
MEEEKQVSRICVAHDKSCAADADRADKSRQRRSGSLGDCDFYRGHGTEAPSEELGVFALFDFSNPSSGAEMNYRHKDALRNVLRRIVSQEGGAGQTAPHLSWTTQTSRCGPAMLLSDKGERMVE